MEHSTYKNLSIPDSTASEDYIDPINVIMKDIGGVHNLIIFADNVTVAKSSLLKTSGSKNFINVEVNPAESPRLNYKRDNSSVEPYDHSFEFLLKNKNIKK